MTLLFRREVYAGRRQSGLGEVVLVAPPGRTVWVALAASAAACVLVLLVFGSYTTRARTSGQLAPTTGMSIVSAASAGVVGAVHVREGDLVEANQLLVELGQDRGSLSFDATSAQISTQISAQRDNLKADLVHQERLNVLESSGLAARAHLLDEQLGTFDKQIRLQQQQVASAQQMLDRVLPLSQKGIISRVQLHQQYEREAVDARAQLLALQRQRLESARELSDLQQAQLQQPEKNAANRSDIERRLADSTQQLAQSELSRASGLRAPRDGLVATVLVSAGQTVRAGQPLLSVLPRDAVVEAQLLVPSRTIGFVESGTTVLLRYPAYPYQKYGTQRGTVLDVSRSSLTREEVESLAGHPTVIDEPLYRVRVRLPRQMLAADGSLLRLLPGMVVEADILLERRSLLEWIFEPMSGMRRVNATAAL